jgi:hypothetical protein
MVYFEKFQVLFFFFFIGNLNSDNSSIIDNFEIKYDQAWSGQGFPSYIYIQFEEFGEKFSKKFVRLTSRQSSYDSKDAYIIDKHSGLPVKYNFQNHRVIFSILK